MRRHARPPLQLAAAAGVVVAVLVVSLGTCVLTYDTMTRVSPNCGGGYAGQTPASFAFNAFDTSAYLMPDYRTVSFPARDDPAIAIAAWWVPGASPASPAVVFVHGLGDCRRGSNILLPAGMLHRDGFGVLLIDLREHGDSTVTNGHQAYGTKEYRDVLGAWDWLRGTQHVDASRIGVWGGSLGASTAMIAMAREPRLAAVWEDSGFADIGDTIAYQATQQGRPAFISAMAIVGGRLRGVDFTNPSPLDLAPVLNGRAIAIVHGESDANVNVSEARRLADAFRHAGGNPYVWILPGVGHTAALGAQPGEYESRLRRFFEGALHDTH